MRKKVLCVLFTLLLLLQPMTAYADTLDDLLSGGESEEQDEMVTESVEFESTIESFAGATKASKYNVVFVVDGSGSIEETDAKNRRMDAMRLFLGLATERGNNVGAVVFTDEILYSSFIREYDSMAEKKELVAEVKSVEIGGWTDIGEALNCAVDMLEEGADSELPSVIILLSDGNTSLDTEEEEEESAVKRETAVQQCREMGCQIFGVMLNADGSANLSELMNLSSATGGVALEVANADDLLSVYETFYELIYNTHSEELLAEEVSDGEIIEKEFTIPAIGVEEINILIDGDVGLSYVELIPPSGLAFTTDELEDMIMRGDNFEIIKLPDPEAGEWSIQGVVDGDGEISIDLVMNRNLTISCDVVGGASPMLNDNVTITMDLKVDGETLTDLSMYPSYSAFVDVYYGNNTTTQEMILSGSSFTTTVNLDRYGIFEIKPYLVESGVNFSGDALSIVVANREPTLTKNAKNTVLAMSGVIFGLKKSIDLNKFFIDAEDEELTYSIEQTEYDADDAYIEDGTLMLKNKGFFGKNGISIVAIDTQGGSTEWSLNVRYVALLLVVAVIVLVLAVLAFLAFKLVFSHNGIYADIGIFEQDNWNVQGQSSGRYGKGPVKYGELNWYGGGHFLDSSTLIFRSGQNLKLMTNKTVYIGMRKYRAFSFVPLNPVGRTKILLEPGREDGKAIEIEVQAG